MRRSILAMAAAASILGPLAAASAADAQPAHRYRDHDWRWDNRSDRYYDRWDHHRHNGYYYRDRWYWGPPPVRYYGNPGLHLGWRHWQRGAYLPPYYRSYVIYDYPRYGLYRPPRGYQWHRAGDDFVLAAIGTGLILEALSR
jgi:Ni/Co efflux regulator RcnB